MSEEDQEQGQDVNVETGVENEGIASNKASKASNADEAESQEKEQSEQSENTEQTGGIDNGITFDGYKWESDEEWQLLLKQFDFASATEEKKQRFINKRKHKYFKDKVDPSHEIPSAKKPSKYSPYQAPPSASNGYDEPTETRQSSSQEEDESKQEELPKKPSKTQDTTEDPSHSHSCDDPSHNHSDSHNHTHSSQQQQQQQQQPRQPGNQPPLMAQLLNYFYTVTQWFVFINCLLSWVSSRHHYYALYGAIAMHIISTFQRHGRPQFNTYYAQAVFQDENVMISLYCLMFLMGPPVFVFLLPIAMRSLYMGCYLLQMLTYSKFPSINKRIQPYLTKVTSQYQWFTDNVALMEVMVGIFLIFGIFFLSRAILLALFYWQVMHARYMMSEAIKQAFRTVNLKIESVLSRVPPVLNIYKKIAAFLYDKVDPTALQERMQQGQSGGGGMMSSLTKMCNVM